MPAQLIDGKAIAADVRADVRAGVEDWTQAGHRRPVLRVVLVGEHPASASYVRGKIRAAAEAGIDSETIRLPADLPQADLLALIDELNASPTVDGILVQLPLPEHVEERHVIHAIDPSKDVDGFHPVNIGRLVLGETGFVPCTPAGIVELLRRTGIETSGARAVVIGRSNIVGKPMASLLLRRGLDATVTVCHSRTRGLAEIASRADILVAAIGRARFVTADMVKPGAAVLDVGVARRDGKIAGDIAADVAEVAGWLSPNPGGVGPMTRAMLLSNVVEAAERALD